MSHPAPPPITLICCSIFLTEVTALHQKYWADLSLRFQSSMLHMHPEKLGLHLESVVDQALKEGYQVVLIYGDCCGLMSSLEAKPGVVRTLGSNCCEILLGHAEYLRLMREGAFFLIPEWVHRWRHVFSGELGLSHENATSFMQDMHRKLIYLDTSSVPVPEAELQACSAYCGLPYEVRPIPLDFLRDAIQEAIGRLETGGGE